MIDSAKFWPEWQRICKRFGRPAEASEAGDYLEYLDQMSYSTEQAVAAARMVWATNQFFPRPADFLEGEASHGWTAICEFADKWSTHLSADDARLLIDAVPIRAKEAIESLGGFDIVRKAKDLPWLRKEYFDAFASIVLAESQTPKLLSEKKSEPVWLRDNIGHLHSIHPTQPSKINVDLLKQLAGVTIEGGGDTEPAPLGWQNTEVSP